MAQPKDPSAANPNRSVQVYQQAVTAFKRQKYDQALALFQRLGQLPRGSPYHLKALMGQVRVYQRLGQGNQVRLLCQQLLGCPSAQAQRWAGQVLSQLPELSKLDAPPALPNAALPNAAPLNSGPPAADLSGFVPLETAGRSLQQSSNLQDVAPVPEQSVPEQKAAIAQAASAEPTKPVPAGKLDSPGDEGRSLFHFHQLNQQAGVDQTKADLAARSPTAFTHQPSQAQAAAPQPASSQRVRPWPALPQHPLMLWLGQGGTAIALLWAINWAFHFALRAIDGGLRWVPWPVRLSLPGANQSYTLWIVGAVVLLGLASPWILDYALARWHRQKLLSTRQIHATKPEVLRLLRQVCRQQGWPLPELRLISDPAPLCFSYGWLPGNTRIVISQGILDHCSDETLTAIYGYELARMVNGSLPVLSAAALLLLLLHRGYRWLAQVGDGLSQPLVQNLFGLVASLVYGLFWLFRQLVLWLSRLCGSWGDRRAVALTRHPDHLAEGLIELTQAIAIYLQRQGSLHPLHISLEVLMPVSSRQAITPGSLLASPDQDRPAVLTHLLVTEGFNPYRQWLRVNASHAPLGERLLWLNRQMLLQGQPGLANLPSAAAMPVSLPLLFLQKAPQAGLVLGGGLAMGLWFLGGIVNRLGWQRLSWLYQDPSILAGGLWLGLGLGLLLRINTLFPEAQDQSSTVAPVAALPQRTAPLPVQGQPIALRGTLRGTAGLGNWGCQDLYLEDSSGLVRLVNPLPLGSLQGWLQGHNHPLRWLGRRVAVTGWARHGGGMYWVDIHHLALDQRHQFTTYGPIWATFISLGSSLIGTAIIFRGG